MRCGDKINEDDRKIINDIANKNTSDKERNFTWYKRWVYLIDKDLTIDQMLGVFKVMSDSKAFKYEHVEYSARESLWRVIKDKMPNQFLLVVL
jgi:hypothetical protein